MYHVHHRRTTCEYSDQCWRISSRPTRCTLHTRNTHTELMSWHMTQQLYSPKPSTAMTCEARIPMLHSGCLQLCTETIVISHSVTVFKSRLKTFLFFRALSLPSSLSSTLPGPSASEVTTLWRYANTFIIIIIIYYY